ncbi:ubiquitinyl hydrolase 1 [Malassezia nana]|uniref:ubiquitinyl hydrolase 1 n=1 Tax=Malassezia nana TaxID=180528 RepID=A0AAF0ELI9_9BASI|nr:ubiquitinyl hydrolase 1 [Malassezia nana]
MLIYCRPLYQFLTQLRSLVPQDLSNSTPLLEAVFRFYNEVPLSDRSSIMVQHDTAPILPDYIYEAMRLHKRFDLFQLGHQEDAEEFFSLILSTLHDEVQLVQRRSAQRQNKDQPRPIPKSSADPFAGYPAPASEESSDEEVETLEIQRPTSPDQDEWLEVGQKGKTSLTRAGGTLDTESPITRIFDGKLRSTLSCPGSKTSVVLEPFRSLPLDIQPSHVHTIQDALRQITIPETISGVWSQQRHAFVDASKQVCLELLPPVLVLHLKRFVFDEVYGVQKSTKPVQYGLTLDITPDIMSPICRRVFGTQKYALFGVIYHHGRLASGGHYTVAVKRQDDEAILGPCR